MSWWRWFTVLVAGIAALLVYGRRHTRGRMREEIEVQKELTRLRKVEIDRGINNLRAELAVRYNKELEALRDQRHETYRTLRHDPKALSAYLVRTAVRARAKRES